MTPLQLAADFVCRLGIPVRFRSARWKNEVLPGLLVWRGGITVDPDRCLGPDDLLHEAGHLAVLPGSFRRYASGDVDISLGDRIETYLRSNFWDKDGAENPTARALLQASESEAIAWGYAAQVYLGLKPRLRLAGSSKQECAETCDALAMGCHFGVHGLQAAGMTKARDFFPKMLRWCQP